ncbi:U-box domain-containing protein 33-like [Quillaja saponaria]|uniref:U-box domain-containing protein 33-like n=1 Tax=Quillaja saponaria TaxID=32244 RepID=A0AAD7P898_QUISA|nr:U-box domain-containing protein 33-like [Quillaja saponaria]
MNDDDYIPVEAKDFYSRRKHYLENNDSRQVFPLGNDDSKQVLSPENDDSRQVFSLGNVDSRQVFSQGNDDSRQVFSLENDYKPEISPEIVEIVEDTNSIIGNQEVFVKDIYVAVGKDDLDVVRWALDHAVIPGSRIFLIHVFPPITYIPTPVGKLSRSQLNQEQVRVYVKEEYNRREYLLHKYIQLCSDAKITVDTVLLESDSTAKAIVDLIPVLNINNLVIGTKKPPCIRRSKKKVAKGEFVKKYAPQFCEVTLVYDGKKVVNGQQMTEQASSPQKSKVRGRIFFECLSFVIE